MATRLQRTKATLDALKDGDTSNEIIGTVLDGFAHRFHAGETLTNDQKAAAFLRAVRIFVRGVAQDAIKEQAAAAANATVDLGADE